MQVLFESSDELAASVARLNRAVASYCPDNPFSTFFICVIDPATGDVVYCNAGHNPPLVIRTGGAVEKLTSGGIMLGILPHAPYQQGLTHLDPGDDLVLNSDGVTEAMPPGVDEEFGDDRLAAVVRSHLSDHPDAIVGAITGAVAEFTEGAPPADDITAVIARRAR